LFGLHLHMSRDSPFLILIPGALKTGSSTIRVEFLRKPVPGYPGIQS